MLNSTAKPGENGKHSPRYSSSDLHLPASASASTSSSRPLLRVDPHISPASDDSNSPSRRQRRRVGGDSAYPSSAPGSAVSLHPDAMRQMQYVERRSSSPLESVSSMSEEELMGAVGQLSLNEDEQVRYHGKASGLHLLGDKERVDGRNKGGIW